MSKQTSQMYGIKVKETINYAEMGDIALYYEDALWTVKSNFENVWRDGVHYDKGDTIVTFQDGEVATFTMMGQHTDVSPYINKLYNVYSNASENPQAGNISVEYRVTNSDRSHGGYSEIYEIVIFKLVNGLIQDRKYISSEDVRKYKMTCDKPVPAWNLTVDWNYTNPQSGYPMKSWVIRSNSNYIKYEEQYYKVGEDLDVFECNDPILMEIVDETQQHETKKKVGEPPLVVVTERVDGGKPTSWSWNRENIVHDVLHTHKDVYYNGHRHKAMYLLYSKTSIAGAYKTVKSLAFAWADPYWFLVTNAEGMEYNGQILKKGQLVKAWSPGDSLNLYIKKDTAVRKPKTDVPYDNITYELLATGDTNVTVIRLVNDEEPPDSRVVVSTSDSPKVCWGIELRVEGPNWTIYSKNNFIKYNGRTYKKNKSILSFGLDEELHIEIKDEENKYYIKSSMTYHVTNEAADSVNYKVRTSKIDRNIIIEKSVNGNEEPWVRVNTYDAIITPYDYEDLSLEFNTVNRSWVLRALSDNVYSDGVKYDTNETIAEWPYTDIKELNHIEALKDSEENIKVAVNVTGVSTEFGQDFDEFVPDDYKDFEILHSSTKALWKILSNTDDAWSSGINYRKGDVILEVPDKTFVDPFTVSVRYYDETQHAYSYRTYSISLTYNALENKTNLIIDPSRGNPIAFNDKTVNEGAIYSITKQNAKSMYGYIWKRDMPGPGPTPPETSFWHVIPVFISSDNSSSPYIYGGNGYRYIALVRSGRPYVEKVTYNSSYNSINLLSKWVKIDELGDEAYLLMWKETQNAKSINIAYYNNHQYTDGIERRSCWDNLYASSGNIYPYPYYSDQKYTGSLSAILFVNNKRTVINVSNQHGYDPQTGEYTDQRIYVAKFTYSGRFWASSNDSVNMEENIFELSTGGFNKIMLLDAVPDWYIFKDSHFLAISHNAIYTYYDTDTSDPQNPINSYCVSEIDLSSLTISGRNLIYNFSHSQLAAKYWPGRTSRLVVTGSDYYFTYGGKQLYSTSGALGYVTKYTFYSYDIEDGSLESLGEYEVDSRVRPTPQNPSNTYVIPMYTRGNKGYAFKADGINIEVRQIEKDNFMSALSGGTVVNTIPYDGTFTVRNIGTGFGETLNWNIFNNNSNLDSIYYNKISQDFVEDTGVFLFGRISVRPVDIVIVYFPDPTLSDLTGAFCFYASALRYSSSIGEE